MVKKTMNKKCILYAAAAAFALFLLSCSSSAGGSFFVIPAGDSVNVSIRDVNYKIVVNDYVSDISVIKSQNGSSLMFDAEECDSYSWTLDDLPVWTEKTYSIDFSSVLEGTYTLSLEAQKGGKRLSYYAQIKVAK